jgi:phosphatidylethanolamine-binding protein (PEBP) family uncharacterized protein
VNAATVAAPSCPAQLHTIGIEISVKERTPSVKVHLGALTLTSPSFEHGQPMPDRHSSNGAGVSPELAWTGVPEGTRSFALIVHDPDAPLTNGFTHWVAYGIPANARSLGEGATEGFVAGVHGMGEPGCVPAARVADRSGRRTCPRRRDLCSSRWSSHDLEAPVQQRVDRNLGLFELVGVLSPHRVQPTPMGIDDLAVDKCDGFTVRVAGGFARLRRVIAADDVWHTEAPIRAVNRDPASVTAAATSAGVLRRSQFILR